MSSVAVTVLVTSRIVRLYSAKPRAAERHAGVGEAEGRKREQNADCE
jgi:hypothetical protein